MRRNILLALIAALALAVGLGNVATANQDSADASAKSGKEGKRGKGKACKDKRGKGKSRGKARRSASASAKGKKGCKGGGANWLELGKYEGQGGVVSVEIRSRTRVWFGADTVCPGIFLGVQVKDAKLTANKLTAVYTAGPGEDGILRRMSLVVTPDYRYKLVVDSSGPATIVPCKPGATFQGKLKKVG